MSSVALEGRHTIFSRHSRDILSTLNTTLDKSHRQKVCKQIRQKQIEKYVTFIHSERGRELEPRKTNKKRANVRFSTDHLLQNAIDEGDDLQVVKYLQEGGDPNFFTGNGTTLLHKCAMEDNVSAADMLVQSGADVNVVDDDWWTPLHTACSCDSVEVAQLLLNNGANVAAIDVDGFFPLDLAAEGAEVKSVMQRHLEQIGMTVDSLHQHRQIRPRDMLNNIKGLPLAADINQLNEEGVSLLHIAAANGYRSCLKALFKYNVDVNRLDWYGWTPLHVAARYNQLRSIEVLLKKKANPNIVDSLGSKPSAVTCSDEIRAILIKAERKCQTVDNSSVTEDKDKTNLVHSDEDISDHRESVYDEIEDVTHLRPLPPGRPPPPPPPTVFRINSKTVRTRHVTISKEDELQEAKAMYEYVSFSNLDEQEAKTKPRGTTRKVGRDQFDDKKETAGESMYEPVAIWKSGGSKKGKLTTCSTTDNLITLTTIKDEAVLKELQVRYEASQIYTLIGDVLIAVNPFRDIEIYSKDISEKYHSRDPGIPLPPHIYEIAENSYQALLRENQSQCHVISGESGSGKTESCKLIVQHLLRDAGSEETQLSAKINQVNPLIEAFGNAITLMNNNSSRYGKYVELNFNKNGKVVGANISEYLLEKSRVVHRGGEECNFHIFYWMNAGLSPEEVSLYKLQNMDRFRYLSGTKMDPSSSNKAKFWEVKDCLKYIGFSTMVG
ncbi:hypothetical protein DPMN_131961 [Dreissena polymorpha]|uniref:Myosin motor domain-containing protein n=1 Tax=Dreissena polymorpha TaxID=45954 RepID=A0A9D4FQP6_DREPO|nr:hypothetical protein DPMN_131961 [Dreissena polymorpha]